jgi:hypothetical protein
MSENLGLAKMLKMRKDILKRRKEFKAAKGPKHPKHKEYLKVIARLESRGHQLLIRIQGKLNASQVDEDEDEDAISDIEFGEADDEESYPMPLGIHNGDELPEYVGEIVGPDGEITYFEKMTRRDIAKNDARKAEKRAFEAAGTRDDQGLAVDDDVTMQDAPREHEDDMAALPLHVPGTFPMWEPGGGQELAEMERDTTTATKKRHASGNAGLPRKRQKHHEEKIEERNGKEAGATYIRGCVIV